MEFGRGEYEDVRILGNWVGDKANVRNRLRRGGWIWSRAVIPKVGYRVPLNHTKSGTIVLAKCIFEQLQLGKKPKTAR